MKFGKTANPGNIDFTLPPDHPGTLRVLKGTGNGRVEPEIYVGAAKWNRRDLPGFYPRGTKEVLPYYASQFNSIELNATFYRLPSPMQIQKWYEATPANFRFFPKVIQHVSHLRRLNVNAFPILEEYLSAVAGFREKLGTVFLQMHANFSPKEWDKFQGFVDNWPESWPLAVEFRHTDWFNNPHISEKLYGILEEKGIGNILVDTPGRRDLLHMRLTNREAFVRFVGTDHPSDQERLQDWVARLQKWSESGLRRISFFMHQDIRADSPLLATYFIRHLNQHFGAELTIPSKAGSGN